MTSGQITVILPDSESYSIEMEEGETLEVGRKPAVGGKRKLVLPFPEVSGQHAEIRCKPNGWTVVDSGSTNGTTLATPNGTTRLTPGREYALRTGDVVEIAQYHLKVNPPADAVEEEEEDREEQDKTQFRIHLINATILVADIKGFTSLSEQIEAGKVMRAAQDFFDVLHDEIVQNYGQLEKIVGDAIMAYWHGDDSKSGASLQAFQACQTSLRLKVLAQEYAKTEWPFKDHPMVLDMALATGPVAAGALGGNNANPALLGDTANLVFRLEKLINDEAAGEIFVESMTHDLAKEHFEFAYEGQFHVKGRKAPVDVHRLVRQKLVK